jgi:hypothetical protein
MNKLGLPTDGGPDGVTVLKQSFDVQPLIQKQADCISVMTYNEYWQLDRRGLQAGPDLVVFNFSAMGNDLLEDGLYVLEDQAEGPEAFEENHGEVRPRVDEGLEIRDRRIRVRRPGSSWRTAGRTRTTRSGWWARWPSWSAPATGKLDPGGLRAHGPGAARPEDHLQARRKAPTRQLSPTRRCRKAHGTFTNEERGGQPPLFAMCGCLVLKPVRRDLTQAARGSIDLSSSSGTEARS